MCGNSDRALEALRRAGAPVTAVDILPDPQIRQDLSAISGWPTIPQVFVKGELSAAPTSSRSSSRAASSSATLREKLGDDYAADARRDDRRAAPSSRAIASTSSACVAGLTLCMTLFTVPSSSITNVERLDAHVGAAHVLLLAPDAVQLGDRVVRVGEQRERQVVLRSGT